MAVTSDTPLGLGDLWQLQSRTALQLVFGELRERVAYLFCMELQYLRMPDKVRRSSVRKWATEKSEGIIMCICGLLTVDMTTCDDKKMVYLVGTVCTHSVQLVGT